MIHVCGKETPNDSKFCIECGQMIDQEYTGVTTRLQKDVEYRGRLEYGYFVASGNPYYQDVSGRYYYPSGRRDHIDITTYDQQSSLLRNIKVYDLQQKIELQEYMLAITEEGTQKHIIVLRHLMELKKALEELE